MYIGSYRNNLMATTQLKEQIVNTSDLSNLKYVSKAYIERCVQYSSSINVKMIM